MSEQINSNNKISYKISKTSEEYTRNQKNDEKEITSQNRNIQRFSNNVISNQNNLVNNLESSAGNMQQRSTDNQSICTCGKFKIDTYSTYNGTIQTNLRSDENCTCDDGKDISLCNCYKKYTNKTTKKTKSYNSNNILIQDNNYCNCDERQKINLTSENEDNILKTNIATDINANINTNTNINTQINKKVCTCGKGEHEFEINTTTSNDVQLDTIETKDNEEKEKIIDTTKINQETIVIKKEERTTINIEKERQEVYEWTGGIYIQIIERLQYLAAEPPELTVQFLNDLMIDRTLDNNPIHILVPIPENFIQKQGDLEVLAEEKADNNENICPENVDILNISRAYSITVPAFNNLDIENINMLIQAQPKKVEVIEPIKKEEKVEEEEKEEEEEEEEEEKEEKQDLQKENHGWSINSIGKTWSGALKPIRTNKLGIEDDIVTINWNDLVQKENVEKFKYEKSIISKPRKFKTIELENNEVILLKAKKRVLKSYTQTEESNIRVGGKGFKLKVWEPVPFLANSMTIERVPQKVKELEKTTQNIVVPPARKRRPDWNSTCAPTSAISNNYLVKEKILEQQKLNPISIIEENKDKNKWKGEVRKQNGVKLIYMQQPKIKKFILSICKEINLFFEHEIDDVIVNDDYNNIQGPQMRPIVVTVIKVNEEEETSSVTSYDVFQNLIVKKTNINFGYESRSDFNQSIELNKNINTGRNYEIVIGNKSNKISEGYGSGEFSKFEKLEGGIKLRMEENRQKSQYDTTVRNLVHQTKNMMSNISGIQGKKKKIEFVKEETNETNYLKI